MTVCQVLFHAASCLDESVLAAPNVPRSCQNEPKEEKNEQQNLSTETFALPLRNTVVWTSANKEQLLEISRKLCQSFLKGNLKKKKGKKRSLNRSVPFMVSAQLSRWNMSSSETRKDNRQAPGTFVKDRLQTMS